MKPGNPNHPLYKWAAKNKKRFSNAEFVKWAALQWGIAPGHVRNLLARRRVGSPELLKKINKTTGISLAKLMEPQRGEVDYKKK